MLDKGLKMNKEQIALHDERYLIPYKGNISVTVLEDLMLVMAKNMEYALQEAGAEKGKDYKILDLFNLAKPFAENIFAKSNRDIAFRTE
jgi:hypothetical protein